MIASTQILETPATSRRRRGGTSRAVDGGSMLLLSILFATILVGLTTAGVTQSTTEILAARRVASMAQEFQWSEYGVDCAIAQLRDTTVPGTIATACSCNTAQVPAPCLVVGARRAVSVTSLTGLPAPPKYKLESVWTSPQGLTTRQVAVVSRTVPFEEAAYGRDALSVTYGALVDSYDSTVFGGYGGSNILANGDVRTNGSAGGATASIQIKENSGAAYPATVKGSAYTPVGASAVYVDPATGVLSGSTTTKPTQTFVDPILPDPPPPGNCQRTFAAGTTISASTSYPEEIICADGNLTVDSAATLDLPNLKTLYVNGNLTITMSGSKLRVGQGTIRTVELRVEGSGNPNTAFLEGTSGLLQIYATGKVAIGPGAVVKGVGNQPRNLRLYSTHSSPDPLVKGVWVFFNTKMYGTVYAPNTLVAVEFDGADVYGAIIGKHVYAWERAKVHYDEALKSVTADLPAWQRAGIITVIAQGSHLTVAASSPWCGDGLCNGSETQSSCSADCGAPAPYCGDGLCNGSETQSSCSADCGAPDPYCGDGICNGSETKFTCSADCGINPEPVM